MLMAIFFIAIYIINMYRWSFYMVILYKSIMSVQGDPTGFQHMYIYKPEALP